MGTLGCTGTMPGVVDPEKPGVVEPEKPGCCSAALLVEPAAVGKRTRCAQQGTAVSSSAATSKPRRIA